MLIIALFNGLWLDVSNFNVGHLIFLCRSAAAMANLYRLGSFTTRRATRYEASRLKATPEIGPLKSANRKPLSRSAFVAKFRLLMTRKDLAKKIIMTTMKTAAKLKMLHPLHLRSARPLL